jgi:hypothetical protein
MACFVSQKEYPKLFSLMKTNDENPCHYMDELDDFGKFDKFDTFVCTMNRKNNTKKTGSVKNRLKVVRASHKTVRCNTPYSKYLFSNPYERGIVIGWTTGYVCDWEGEPVDCKYIV